MNIVGVICCGTYDSTILHAVAADDVSFIKNISVRTDQTADYTASCYLNTICMTIVSGITPIPSHDTADLVSTGHGDGSAIIGDMTIQNSDNCWVDTMYCAYDAADTVCSLNGYCTIAGCGH